MQNNWSIIWAVSHGFCFSTVSSSTAHFEVCVSVCLRFQEAVQRLEILGVDTEITTIQKYPWYHFQTQVSCHLEVTQWRGGMELSRTAQRFWTLLGRLRAQDSLHRSVFWRDQSQQQHKLGTDRQDVQNWDISYLTLEFIQQRQACCSFFLLAIRVMQTNVRRNLNFSG